MSQEQQEQVLQNSEPQAVDVTVNVGGESRAERFLGTFDQISRLSLDIDRNYGNKRVLTDFPLVNDGTKWTGTINKLIVGFDYTITGHAYKCLDCPEVIIVNVSTFSGNGSTGSTNGQGVVAKFNKPQGIAVDSSGNVYVADYNNHMIRKIDPSGNVTTLAGSTSSGSTNGQGASAKFKFPIDVAADSFGNVYVADKGNHLIRRIDSSGNVTTLAGSVGSGGLTNGQGTAAKFSSPYGVEVDLSGNIFVADHNNHQIRKIDPAGNVSTFAGSGTAGFANGQGTNAKFNKPIGLALDILGNLFVADANNNRIRMVDPSGNVTTLAGTGSSGSSNGLGTEATFNYPRYLAVDSFGNLYHPGSNLIRKIDSLGNVTTLAGTGSQGSDNGLGNEATFNAPTGVAIDQFGNLYVSDDSNNMIRKLTLTSEKVISDNNTYQEIFRGSTQHTVIEGTNTLNLRLSPLLDDRELTAPRITRINRPFQMVASTSDNITVAVDTVKKDGSSAVDATLSYRFRSVDNDSLPLNNITGGSFSPASGDVTKSGSSYPDISTTYTAPDNDSTMKLQVRVSNELEIGVTSHFNVYVTDDIETQNTIDTNPVIENISAERLDNGDLKWTMNVSNDDGFSGLKVKWEYMFGDNRSFTSQSNTVTQGDSNRGVMQATMSGYKDSDDGMLLVTVCEDGGSAGIPYDCAYMNQASTSISMELIPGAYEQPIICDGNSCSHDYEGTWIACDTNDINPGGDDSFVASRKTLTIGSGKINVTAEYLKTDDGSCNGEVALTWREEISLTDNGSKINAELDGDNVSASQITVRMLSSKLSFQDLSYIDGLKPDNETYLCGESYWTGIEKEVSGCNFKYKTVKENSSDNDKHAKGIIYVTDNNSMLIEAQPDTYPTKFGCGIFGAETSEKYIYPTCTSSSSSSSSSNNSSHNVTLTPDTSNGVVYDHDESLTFAYDTAGPFTHSEAQNYCSDLNLAGHDDWYLPRWELERVVGSTVFSSTSSSIFWSDFQITNDIEEDVSSGYMYEGSSDLELGSDRGEQIVGIRFNLPVPQGATINNAYIQFTVDEDNNDDPVNFTIKTELTDNASEFALTQNNLSDRPTSSNQVTWSSIPQWNNEGDNGTDQQTPDLSSIIQEVVNRSGWSQGNAAVFLIEGQGTRTAISYDKDPSKAPKLFIQFNGGSLTEVSLEATNQPLAIDIANQSFTNLNSDETALVRCVRNDHSSSNRFHSDSGAPVIWDHDLNLVWSVTSFGPDTWSNASNFCSSEFSASGFSQGTWRLPNTEELRSLADDSNYPKIASVFVDNTSATEKYWSDNNTQYNNYHIAISYDDPYSTYSTSDSDHLVYRCVVNSSSSSSSSSGGIRSLMGGAIQGNPLNLSGTVSDFATGFSYPGDVTTDGNGNLYVADSGNHIIRKVVISTGDVSILAGSIGQKGYVDDTGPSARFNSPLAITSDGTNLYVTDKGSSYVRKIVISSGVVTSLANHGGGQAYGITTDGTNLYITNTNGDTIQKVVISSGAVSTFAGSGSEGSLDGTGTSAQFNQPNDITTDGTNLYVAERYGHKIRKIVISSAVVSIIAGCGSDGSNDGTGTDACFNKPNGIATDGTNLFVLDTHNHILRKIVISTKVVTTLATGFNLPGGLTTDGTYLYAADSYSHKLKKIE